MEVILWIEDWSIYFVVRDYYTSRSVIRIMEELKWLTLEERRKKVELMPYKIIHVLLNAPADQLIPSETNYKIRGRVSWYRIPYSRTNGHQESFFPSAFGCGMTYYQWRSCNVTWNHWKKKFGIRHFLNNVVVGFALASY